MTTGTAPSAQPASAGFPGGRIAPPFDGGGHAVRVSGGRLNGLLASTFGTLCSPGAQTWLRSIIPRLKPISPRPLKRPAKTLLDAMRPAVGRLAYAPFGNTRRGGPMDEENALLSGRLLSIEGDHFHHPQRIARVHTFREVPKIAPTNFSFWLPFPT